MVFGLIELAIHIGILIVVVLAVMWLIKFLSKKSE
jgi:hypothetical protein